MNLVVYKRISFRDMRLAFPPVFRQDPSEAKTDRERIKFRISTHTLRINLHNRLKADDSSVKGSPFCLNKTQIKATECA